MSGELDKEISTAGVSFHIRPDGRRTVFFHATIKTDESQRTDIEDFTGKLKSVYGECMIDTI